MRCLKSCSTTWNNVVPVLGRWQAGADLAFPEANKGGLPGLSAPLVTVLATAAVTLHAYRRRRVKSKARKTPIAEESTTGGGAGSARIL
ncbi:hypothetical protein [Christensenella tenuis]|uniref:Uncharacterized protein n=1 Tax=Christensenella tenuis TaxID=2763033 RepID=A0ABR7EF98_9FIRM|nr:hypothetical protein [Christensenella tenuis]MBC5648438.1 hypothetical protein [Christensenella tenuis]